MAGTTRPHRAVTLTAGGVPRIFEPLFTVFGDGDSSGGSTNGRDWQDDDLMLQRYQMPVGGRIVSIMPWIRSGTGTFRAVAYANSAGEPAALVASAEFNVVTAPDDFLEVALDPADYFDVTAGDFIWLGVQANGGPRSARRRSLGASSAPCTARACRTPPRPWAAIRPIALSGSRYGPIRRKDLA